MAPTTAYIQRRLSSCVHTRRSEATAQNHNEGVYKVMSVGQKTYHFFFAFFFVLSSKQAHDTHGIRRDGLKLKTIKRNIVFAAVCTQRERERLRDRETQWERARTKRGMRVGEMKYHLRLKILCLAETLHGPDDREAGTQRLHGSALT